jgi:hypothetical protein
MLSSFLHAVLHYEIMRVYSGHFVYFTTQQLASTYGIFSLSRHVSSNRELNGTPYVFIQSH